MFNYYRTNSSSESLTSYTSQYTNDSSFSSATASSASAASSNNQTTRSNTKEAQDETLVGAGSWSDNYKDSTREEEFIERE